MSKIDDLMAQDDVLVHVEVLSPEELARRILAIELTITDTFGIAADQLPQALRDGTLPEDELIDEWIVLDALRIASEEIPA